jgi:hypothetical protein
MLLQGKATWTSFASVGLRNELRLPLTGAPTLELYTWDVWKKYMTAAASAVHAANPDVLIFFSGLDSDFNIEPAVGGSAVQDPGFSFSVASYEFANKFVFEIHEYDEGISNWCFLYKQTLLAFGFDATSKSGHGANRVPLVVSEWGHDQSDASGAYKSAYSTCLVSVMEQRQLGWMLWVLAGSYYIRSGTQDSDETYGTLPRMFLLGEIPF